MNHYSVVMNGHILKVHRYGMGFTGKYVEQFEHNIAEYTGSNYAIAVVNGTSALHIALMLAGVKGE